MHTLKASLGTLTAGRHFMKAPLPGSQVGDLKVRQMTQEVLILHHVSEDLLWSP